MSNTTRRNLLKITGAAGMVAGLGLIAKPEAGTPGTAALAAEEHDHGHGGDDKRISSSLSNATVSFGAWQSGPAPFDRFAPNDPNDRTRNHHRLLPNVAKIEEGGSVNFIVAGFHNVLVYDHGVEPKDINRTLLIPAVPGVSPALINDPNKRIYRGLDPRTLGTVQDRTEVVQFATRGLYLVICGVLGHFFNATTQQFEMFGYVRVVKSDDRD